MQHRKVQFICSVAGKDTTNGSDFCYGKGAVAELTPEQCHILRHFIIYLDPTTELKTEPKNEIPIAIELKKKPVNKKKPTKKKK